MTTNTPATATPTSKPPVIFRTLVRLQNPFMKWLLRSPLHSIVSGMYVLLTVTGRKSGKTYTIPVQYVQSGETLYIISSEGYTWWKNLRGGAELHLRLRGRELRGYAETSIDPQVIAAHIEHVYPSLSAERRQKFIPGKVAITITLPNS